MTESSNSGFFLTFFKILVRLETLISCQKLKKISIF